MPTWGEILNELNRLAPALRNNRFDHVRRNYLIQLASQTNRSTILYATKWTSPSDAPPELISITEEDIQGFMEVVHGLPTTGGLDLILHTPGGSPNATEGIVKYLRSKFSDIRVIVPQAAMSAGTMLACASNRIVMGKHSFLGPVDPQLFLGTRAVACEAIIEQFRIAQKQCHADPKKLPPWVPILAQYGPGLLVECENALKLSKKLAREWLGRYMFGGTAVGRRKAVKISKALSSHLKLKSHGRHIDREWGRAIGLVIDDLESDSAFQDGVLSVFHSATHTFNGTQAVKIIENNLGKAFVRTAGRQIIQLPMPMGPAGPTLPAPQPNPPTRPPTDQPPSEPPPPS